MLDPRDIPLDLVDSEEANLDEDYEETKTKKYMHEGGEAELAFPKQASVQQEEEASDQDSVDTQLFVDEKKEIIEEVNVLGRVFGNTLALCWNLGIFISVLALFIDEGYYDLPNQYVWVFVFFGAQLFSIFVADALVLYVMALSVSRCCKHKKTLLAKIMRESLYVYEDYRYVVQFANTRIQ